MPRFTLPRSAVTIKGTKGRKKRTHESGWTISGDLHNEFYVWIEKFKACHPKYGRVFGNFEKIVEADSEEGFKHFWKYHPPEAWDYGDV